MLLNCPRNPSNLPCDQLLFENIYFDYRYPLYARRKQIADLTSVTSMHTGCRTRALYSSTHQQLRDRTHAMKKPIPACPLDGRVVHSMASAPDKGVFLQWLRWKSCLVIFTETSMTQRSQLTF
jgi:hypothetical protein